jgi:glycosyltransferase involved in cell wall biosynthesis
VRNEAEHFAQTIASMVAQTLRPACWVIVNDGSTDGTGALADQAVKDHPWIRLVHRTDRGTRKPGGGVIEAFYDGFALLCDSLSVVSSPVISNPPSATRHSSPVTADWSFLVKLDGDLSFPPDYFAQCFARFAADPGLGIGGGRVYYREGDRLVDDAPGDPAFHVRGATKIYRRATWEGIGGLLRAPGWDTLDELKANMLGWRTCSFKELKVLQLKPTGSADGNWRNWFKNGRANYITGYHPLFMLTKCLKRLISPPVVIGATGLFCGYTSGYLKRVPQVADAELIRYLRRQQLNRLTFRESLWR